MKMLFKNITRLFVVCVVLTLMVTGCKTQRDITRSQDLFLLYDMYPAKESMAPIEKGFRTMVKKKDKETVYKQGFCAEYAVALAVMEKYADAFEWFNKEIKDYPMSDTYISSLKKEMIPDSTLQVLENTLQQKLEKERKQQEAKRAKEEARLESQRKKAEAAAAREAQKLEKKRQLEAKKMANDSIRLEKERKLKEKEQAKKEAERIEKERIKAEQKAAKAAEKAKKEAEKKAEREEEAKIKAELEAEKKAEKDEIAKIKAEIKAEKKAEKEERKREKEREKAEKQREKEELKAEKKEEQELENENE